MKKMIKAATWLMAASLMASFILIPAKPASATVYKYEWVSQSGTVSPDGYAHQYTGLVAGQTINLSLTLINRSGTTIIGKGALPTTPGYQVPIGTWGVGTQNPQDGIPYFLDSSSFVLNHNRFVYYDGPDVSNGGYFTLNWSVKLANGLSDGVYDLYYRPVCEYLAWTRQYKNGHTLPGTDSDIFTRFIVGSGISPTIPGDWQKFTNTKWGYSLYYPKTLNGKKVEVGSNDYGVMNPSLAASIYITQVNQDGSAIGDEPVLLNVESLFTDWYSNEMNLQEYATRIWQDNKNHSRGFTGDLVATKLANQSTYRFDKEGSFSVLQDASVQPPATGWGGWVLNYRTVFSFFKTNSGRILMIYWPANHTAAQQIINSVTVS